MVGYVTYKIKSDYRRGGQNVGRQNSESRNRSEQSMVGFFTYKSKSDYRDRSYCEHNSLKKILVVTD